MLDTASMIPQNMAFDIFISAENAAAASFRHGNLHSSNFESRESEMFQENDTFLCQEHATIWWSTVTVEPRRG
jgi:hypothetical protein